MVVEDGIAVHLGGGLHHAFAGHGEGFCLFNDVAVSVRRLQRDGRRTYRQGEAFMEAMGVAHFGANSGSQPMRLLAVYMGAEGADDVAPAK